MQIAQAIGPFSSLDDETSGIILKDSQYTNDWVNMPENLSEINWVCTHIGIQCPQSPYITECSTVDNMVKIKVNDFFIINANEILEFDDIKYPLDTLTIQVINDKDRYTIIDLGYKEITE